METDQSLREVDGATAEEPPLGGLTHLDDNQLSHHPAAFDRNQIAEIAHTLDPFRTASLLGTDIR
jgi:hypothetical protein